MQTSHQTNLVAPIVQPLPQLQDDTLQGAVADNISPAGVIAPLHVAQLEAQAVGPSNGQRSTPGLESARGSSQAVPTPQRYVVSKPVNDARGHTGYLTFARRSVDD